MVEGLTTNPSMLDITLDCRPGSVLTGSFDLQPDKPTETAHSKYNSKSFPLNINGSFIAAILILENEGCSKKRPERKK
jgi:hypothetical protein